MSLIKIEHLHKEYPNVTPLVDVNVEIHKGDVISVIGPSGTGKSTLLRCLNRLEEPTGGTITLDGEVITSPSCDITRVRRKMGMVFARMLNLSKMGYLRYETGDRTPSYQTIVFMAQKLGTSPEYLTGEEDTPEPLEYIISKTDDPELFALIQDMMDTKNPARTRLLAYYKKLKAAAMK